MYSYQLVGKVPLWVAAALDSNCNKIGAKTRLRYSSISVRH